MTEKNTKKGKDSHRGVKTGIALTGAAAALAAAAAGYYFYASKDAKKNRRNAAKWATGFKKEAMAQIEKLNKLDRAAIAGAVDRASSLYESAKNVHSGEIARAAQELKNHWRDLASEFSSGRSKKKKSTKSGSRTKKTSGAKSTRTSSK